MSNKPRNVGNPNEDKTVRWLLIFLYVVFFIQLYNFVSNLMLKM